MGLLLDLGIAAGPWDSCLSLGLLPNSGITVGPWDRCLTLDGCLAGTCSWKEGAEHPRVGTVLLGPVHRADQDLSCLVPSQWLLGRDSAGDALRMKRHGEAKPSGVLAGLSFLIVLICPGLIHKSAGASNFPRRAFRREIE